MSKIFTDLQTNVILKREAVNIKLVINQEHSEPHLQGILRVGSLQLRPTPQVVILKV